MAGQLAFERERGSMFYVVLIIVAIAIAGGLYMVRGRRSA
jgi:hypothetical protein